MESNSSSLNGRTVVVTRAPSQASSWIQALEQQGATVQCFPLLQITPIPFDAAKLTKQLKLRRYEAILLTSQNAVHFGLEQSSEEGLTYLRESRDAPKLWAVGKATASALKDLNLNVDFIAPRAQATALLEQLLLAEVKGKTYLFPCSLEARTELPRGLEEAGATVDQWPVYQPSPANTDLDPLVEQIGAGQIDVVTLASPSTVRFLFEQQPCLLQSEWLHQVMYAAIGPTTEQALRERGVSNLVVADPPGLPGLLKAILLRYS